MPPSLSRKDQLRRQKQTRLSFEPVDKSSSPAKGSPAKIRYQAPSGKKPTSSYTVDDDEEDEDDDSEDILASSKRANARGGTQQRKKASLFKSLPTPVKSSGFSSSFGALDIENDEETLPRRPTRSMGNNQGLSQLVDDSSDGSTPEEVFATPSKKTKKSKAFQITPIRGNGEALDANTTTDSSIPEELEEQEQATTKKTKKSKRAKASQIAPVRGNGQILEVNTTTESSLSEEEASMPEDPVASRMNRTPRVVAQNNDWTSSSRSTQSKPLFKKGKRQVALDEDSDDDVPSLPRRSASKQNHTKTVELSSDSEEDDTHARAPRSVQVESTDDDDELLTSRPKRKRGRPVAEEDSDSDIISSPLKRRRGSPQIEGEDENEGTDEDIPAVRNIVSKRKSRSNSGDAAATTTRSTRQQKPKKRHRTQMEKTMELLKRRRAGEKITELTPSESDSGEESAGLYDTDSDLKALSEFDDEEASPEEQKPKKKAIKKHLRKEPSDGTDDYDADFVVDDEDDLLGIPDPGLLSIPLEFTHAAHKPLKDHFKDAVEWMVHNKVNPKFNRLDPIYVQAFRKLDDEYTGYAKSKFTSTQWTDEFTKALNARPEYHERDLLEGEGMTAEGVPKCDACNHRKHVPSYAIQFKGKPYNKDTLEEVEHDSDDENGSYNDEGYDIATEDQEWMAGRFCRNNAQQAHTLIHWKYALNTWVVDALDTSVYMEPATVVAREKLKPKKRREEANGIVDEWDADGQIASLYRDFKGQLEVARTAEVGGARWR